ncbi:TVP38/TMEM64 family protein [Priestia endophytica]|uniref:TVP38/TMEM64 family protein n=1 Tax=Priestia endophytica TaxID=135735 RepID=UPI00077C4F6B|nr:TVP38/TMEM64 family protein [Priestia endophytica]KYG31117.1 hypothetical protein AZF06_05020 [Priestia endophytica]MBG9810963.1 hypothetical protein [Priestia endophytica]MBG9813479.1 hypothetical protein [Priestia endophytica]
MEEAWALNEVEHFFTLENILDLLNKYQSFGLLPGILLPFLEAFIPILPLFVFVVANSAAFGLWLGFLISWLGAVGGALCVFLLVRKYGQRRIFNFLHRHQQVRRVMDWLERHGFGPLFIMLCFPFTPSAAINVVAGLSRVSMAQFALAVMAGKMVMIFAISYIGEDIGSFFREPLKTIIVLAVIVILWIIGKRIEIHLNTKTGYKQRKRERG